MQFNEFETNFIANIRRQKKSLRLPKHITTKKGESLVAKVQVKISMYSYTTVY